jgi:hypothetical protein
MDMIVGMGWFWVGKDTKHGEFVRKLHLSKIDMAKSSAFGQQIQGYVAMMTCGRYKYTDNINLTMLLIYNHL